jgi:raffinose/stachyose/melibiose transport system substrate-binding protein
MLKKLIRGGVPAGLFAAGLVFQTASAFAEDVTLKMWTLTNPDYPEYIEERKAAFKKLYPNVEIVLESTPNEAYKTAIQVALVGSEPPDVFFNWSGEDAARLAREGLALDISELGKKDGGFRNMLSPSWQASFMVDGRNYGIPTDAITKYFYYNKDFFAQNDLSPPETFGELLNLCKAIRKVDARIVPMPLGNSERWKLNHFITLLDERVMGIDGTAADYALTASADELFTDPGYVTAWQKILDLKEAGCFQNAPNATSPEATRSMFSGEIAPMIFCGSWCMSTFDNDGFTNYGMFRFPRVEGGKSDGTTNMVIPQGLQISAKTKHPEEAVAWASFLVTPESALGLARARAALPSNAEKIHELEGASEQFKWMAKDMASLSASFNVLDVLLEASVANAYLDAGVEVLNGTKTPEEAVAAIRATALEAKKKMETQ